MVTPVSSLSFRIKQQRQRCKKERSKTAETVAATKERGLKEADRVAPMAKTVATMKMPAATLYMACNRKVVSAKKPETYKNEGVQRNGTERQSGSAEYCGTNEDQGKQ